MSQEFIEILIHWLPTASDLRSIGGALIENIQAGSQPESRDQFGNPTDLMM